MKTASVKVMNSYDYCYFEVVLGIGNEFEVDAPDITAKEVNELRKQAQRLVDNAIRQYKIAKERSNQRANLDWERKQLIYQCKRIEKRPEGERTEQDKAKLKALDDHAYWSQYDYDYGDDDDVAF